MAVSERATTYSAVYEMTGGRLLNKAAVEFAAGARRVINLGFDPVGRVTGRREIKDGALDWDAFAAMKLPYDDLVKRVMSTPGELLSQA